MDARTPAIALLLALVAAPAAADEPITQRNAWEGRVDFFMTGAPLAVDTDGDFRVDSFDLPATIEVSSADVEGQLVAAWLYWGGSRAQPVGLPCDGTPDDEVTVTYPQGSSDSVTGTCYCSDGDASSYDVWVCRGDVTAQLNADGGDMVGDFLLDDYDGLAANASTHNHSAALLLVYSDSNLPPRRVVAYDGNLDLRDESETVTASGVDVGSTPSGDVTLYVLEGDIAGSGNEQVTAQGMPGGTLTPLSDSVNPVDNPFNQTINTTSPAQTGLVGVDIDQFDITSALAPMDTSVDVRITAGNDKFWVAATVLGVDLFDPAFGQNTTKELVSLDDQNVDGEPTPGDTVRFAIRLQNDGNEAGTIDVVDPLPDGVASATVVDTAGGTDASSASELRIEGVTVGPGESSEVIVEMEIGDVEDLDEIANVASWTAPLQGGMPGSVAAEPVVARADFDGDLVFDSDDNCPMTANAGQDDGDGDGIGDACDDDFVEPDMGGERDAGADAGPDGMDSGFTGRDTGASPDASTSSDAGGTTPDGGTTAGDDAGADASAGPGGNQGPPQSGKGDPDTGCCSTVEDRPLPIGFVLVLIVLIEVGRRLRPEHRETAS